MIEKTNGNISEIQAYIYINKYCKRMIIAGETYLSAEGISQY